MEKKPRGWRRPEAPRKASGFIRSRRSCQGEGGEEHPARKDCRRAGVGAGDAGEPAEGVE